MNKRVFAILLVNYQEVLQDPFGSGYKNDRRYLRFQSLLFPLRVDETSEMPCVDMRIEASLP
jgi:hypothetical protein